MRKFYISLLALLICVSTFSQKVPLEKRDYKQSQKMTINPFVEDGIIKSPRGEKQPKPAMPIADNTKSMWLWEQVIGYTTYDNQANNSMQNRIIIDDQERAHATWTMSFQNNTTWTDRGTGYNTGEGYVWGEVPYDRLESVRTGWPGLFKTANGGEAYICHTGTGPVSLARRPTIGSGAWTIATVPTDLNNDFLWPRAAVDGNTVHVIALSAPTGLDGTLLNGLNGNLVYWRSDDNGDSWAIQDHIFDQLSADEYAGIAADSYAIDARNGQVSIAIFSEIHDSSLLNSIDGGDNWSYTIFMDFPIAGYVTDDSTDIEGDGIIDTLMSSDGVGALLIDGNGISHVTFGEFYFYDDTEGDTLYSVFLTDRLLYWNSSYAPDELYIIGTFEENVNDNNTTNDITIAQAPDYRAGLASMPTMAEDPDGNIFVVFSAADEEYLGDQVFRHLYATTSDDSGATWSLQTELTPDEDFNEYEYTFPSMVKMANDKLHIVVQRDQEPGLIVRGDLDNSEENEIVYLAVTTDLDISIGMKELAKDFDFSVFPNPSNGIINISGDNLAGMMVKLYDKAGKELVNTRIAKSFNTNDKQVFDFSYLPAGLYTLSVGNGSKKMTKEILISK